MYYSIWSAISTVDWFTIWDKKTEPNQQRKIIDRTSTVKYYLKALYVFESIRK